MTALALTFAGFTGVIHLDNALRQERKASDRCWIDGGTYKDGNCEKPEDKMSPAGKVCNALHGSYMVVEDGKTMCYSYKGEKLKMPSVEDKEVVLMDDGTVVIYDKKTK